MGRRSVPFVHVLDAIEAPLAKRARRAADWLHEQADAGRQVTVVHHIDADGVTAGAIALETLARAGIKHQAVAAKSLDDVHIDAIATGGHEALWFCDFGSTAYMHFDAPKLVCDHHELVRDGHEDDFPHVNPLLDGIPGDTISGAGCAVLVALAYDDANLDLLPLALVGATGDLQDRVRGTEEPREGGSGQAACDRGGLQGANAVFVQAAQAAGLVTANEDLAFFGSQTRPLRTFLAHAELKVPGATGSQRAAEAFLTGLGIELRGGDGERSYSDLDDDERRILQSGLVDRLLDCAVPLDGLTRTVITIDNEAPGSPTRELQEYGTLLNSTARYDRPTIGLAVARGDRDAAYQEALSLRDDHKKHLVQSLDAFGKAGVQEMRAVQWAHLEDMVRDTVVGIVCGMALNGLGLRRDMPLIGFAHTPDGRTKVSSRAPHELKGRIDLATAMREGAAAFDGQGGGHAGAAGATIPRGSEPAFLDVVDAVVAKQLGIAPSQEPAATEAEAAQPEAAFAVRPGQARLF